MGSTRASPAEHPLIVAAYLAEATGEIPLQLPRHRHAIPRDTVRASQIVRILQATAEVVAGRGYADTSVAEIVKRAGVSSRTYYELFADKEEAFLAAYAAIDLVIARMTAAALERSDPRAMLRAGTRSYLEQLAREPAFTRMLVIEAVGAGPRVLRRRAEAFRAFARALTLPRERSAPADGIPVQTDEALLLAVVGGINELVLQHLVDRDPLTLTELSPAVEELLERVFFPPAAGKLAGPAQAADPPLRASTSSR